MKLSAFQIRFFLNVTEWARGALPQAIVEAYDRLNNPRLMVRAMYNSLGGRPTAEMMARFQQEAKGIQVTSSFAELFDKIGMHRSDMEIQTMLCDAMIHSERCKYHRLR